MKPILRSASVLALAGAALAAAAQNLVVNPGFEAGFAGWDTTAAVSGSDYGVVLSSDGSLTHSGTHAAFFSADAGLPDTVSQTIATVPGASYTVSFYLRESSPDPNSRPTFAASFAGAGASFGIVTQTYALATFSATATSASTILSFRGYNSFNSTRSYLLDDVSVQAVPEPSALAALGLGALALLKRRKRA